MDENIEFVTCLPGPQTEALKSPADVVIMGGANGGGKTRWLLLEAARHVDVAGYRGVVFRRESTDITNPGGLWDETMKVYPQIGGWPRSHKLDWVFEPDARVSFRHLQYFADAVSWDGTELAFIGFDEGNLFLESQFWYLFSRMRSTCGKRPVVRMSCNPVHETDPTGGWLKVLIGWWLDWDTGFPIQERSGVIRWFVRLNNEIHWADSKRELIDRMGDPDLPDDHEDQPVQPMSLTFVPSKLKDNPILSKTNPQYRASLMALPEHLKQQKLDGNWNAKLQAGTYFKVAKIEIVDALPVDLKYCRAWDVAHTEGAGDYTAGPKLGKGKDGTYYIADMVRGQWESSYRDAMIKQTAITDDAGEDRVTITVPQDPSAGKSEAARLVKMLAGHHVKVVRPIKAKEVRAAGFASQLNAGNVKMLKAPWNAGLLQRLDAFPTKGIPDDECFVAGTRIQLIRGHVPIENVRVEDFALTRFGWRKVEVSTTTHHAMPIWTLVTTDGRTLRCTQRHPFFIVGKGMVPLDQCSIGEMLVNCYETAEQKSGWDWKTISAIKEIIPSDELEKVYNLCVEEEHEYFANGILCSNCDSLADAFQQLATGSSGVLVSTGPKDVPDDEKPAEHPFGSMVGDDKIRELWLTITKDEPCCPRWRESFAAFRDDIGERPTEDHILMKRNPNDIYDHYNCFWGLEGQVVLPPKKRRAMFSGG